MRPGDYINNMMSMRLLGVTLKKLHAVTPPFSRQQSESYPGTEAFSLRQTEVTTSRSAAFKPISFVLMESHDSGQGRSYKPTYSFIITAMSEERAPWIFFLFSLFNMFNEITTL